MTRTLLFFHLIGAAIWLGGLVTVGALVPALRSAGVDRPQLQAMARQFGRVSWAAMAISIVSGTWLVLDTDRDWGDLSLKLGLVFVAIALAAAHQVTAKRSTPAQRGAIQGLVLFTSLAIFFAAAGL